MARTAFTGRAALALICLLFAWVPAWAEEASLDMLVAGKQVILAVPEKTCAYNREDKADARILEAMEKADPRNQLLLAFIDCENRKMVRGVVGASSPPGYYGQILSDISGQALPDQYTREAYVEAMAKQYPGTAEANMVRGEQELQALLDGKSDGKPETIGLIKKDKDFIQIAIIGSMQTPTGGVQKIINVVTYTKLGVPVSIYLAHPAGDGLTLRTLSERAEIYVRKLIELNSEGVPLFENGIEPGSLCLGFIAGVVISIIFAAIFRKGT